MNVFSSISAKKKVVTSRRIRGNTRKISGREKTHSERKQRSEFNMLVKDLQLLDKLFLLFNFIEIALRHGCSPVNLLHICRTSFSKNAFGGLLL